MKSTAFHRGRGQGENWLENNEGLRGECLVGAVVQHRLVSFLEKRRFAIAASEDRVHGIRRADRRNLTPINGTLFSTPLRGISTFTK
jgi:hypothetical protein